MATPLDNTMKSLSMGSKPPNNNDQLNTIPGYGSTQHEVGLNVQAGPCRYRGIGSVEPTLDLKAGDVFVKTSGGVQICVYDTITSTWYCSELSGP